MKNQYTKTTKIGNITIIEEDNKISELHLSSSSCCDTKITKSQLLKEAFNQLDEYLEGKRKIFELPLNPSGTSFQRSVWNQLLKIPYGKTVYYQEIAIALNRPKAQRAIGMANNHNPIPIFIPCHRVIGKNGNLTGYAGGLQLKNFLLNLEQNQTNLFCIYKSIS